MSDIVFRVTLDDLESARQEYYLQGIMQGEKNVEEVRIDENKLWQELTTNLRKLAKKHGATFDEIDSCWRVKESKPVERKKYAE